MHSLGIMLNLLHVFNRGSSVVSHKNVTKVVMSMVSLLRLKGYGGQAGVSVQVLGK